MVAGKAAAGEDPILLQPPDALEAARRGEIHSGGQLFVRKPSIVLQGGQYREIDSVQARLHGSSPKSIRLTVHSPN